MTQETGRKLRLALDSESTKSNLPLLIIASAFLGLTIMLVLLQSALEPDAGQQTAQSTAEPAAQVTQRLEQARNSQPLNAPLAAALRGDTAPAQQEEQGYDVVTRAQMPLLTVSFTPIEQITSAAITEQLRQPIRLFDTGVPKRDLPTLTDDVLHLLSPDNSQIPPKLVDLLTEAITQRQSDGYIRALLNAAVERGDFDVPPVLQTTDGTLDAHSLLKAMAQTAGSPVPKMPDSVETYGTQKIVPGDSLARLALRYYGQPLKYDIILAANPQIDPLRPSLTPGDVIQMPKP